MGRLDGTVQLILAVGLVAAIVYGCRPRPARPDPLIRRQAESHLTHCSICRRLGTTVDDLAGVEKGSPCVIGGMSENMGGK